MKLRFDNIANIATLALFMAVAVYASGTQPSSVSEDARQSIVCSVLKLHPYSKGGCL